MTNLILRMTNTDMCVFEYSAYRDSKDEFSMEEIRADMARIIQSGEIIPVKHGFANGATISTFALDA